MKRRQFFKNSIPALALPAVISNLDLDELNADFKAFSSAESPITKSLIVVHLDGGFDPLQAFLKEDLYENLSRLRAGFLPEFNSCIDLPKTDFKMNASLKELGDLYHENKIKIFPALGNNTPVISHQTAMGNAILNKDNSTIFSRCLNENFNAKTQLTALSIHVNDPQIFKMDDVRLDIPIIFSNNDWSLIQRSQTTLNLESLQTAINDVSKLSGFSDTSNALDHDLEMAFKCIRGGLNIPVYFVRMNGFDTHQNHVVTQEHNMKVLSKSLSQLYRKIEEFGLENEVQILAFSEMGRSVQKNKHDGSEHGSTASAFMIGNFENSEFLGDLVLNDDQLVACKDWNEMYQNSFIPFFQKTIEI